jgi:hypothetical protein
MLFKNTHQNKVLQAGGVIIWILVMVALFALVSFALIQGSRTTASTVGGEKVRILVSEVLNYGQQLRDGVAVLKAKGCKDEQISFDQIIDTLYNNPVAPTDNSCHVFNAAGAGLRFDAPSSDWLDTTQSAKPAFGRMIVTGHNTVHQTGTDCASGGTTCSELLLIVPYIKPEICRAINKSLSITPDESAAPPIDLSTLLAERFIGVYENDDVLRDGPGADLLLGHRNGCIQVAGSIDDITGTGGDLSPTTGTYHYFHILMVR